jgi:hypothetical protein
MDANVLTHIRDGSVDAQPWQRDRTQKSKTVRKPNKPRAVDQPDERVEGARRALNPRYRREWHVLSLAPLILLTNPVLVAAHRRLKHGRTAAPPDDRKCGQKTRLSRSTDA